LVVDDNPLTLRLYRRALELRGFHVLDAGTFGGAVRAAYELLPDVVLVDLYLDQGHGGLELCQLLRDTMLSETVPIVLFSGKQVTGEHRVQAEDIGAAAFLNKADGPTAITRTLLRLADAPAPTGQGRLRSGPDALVLVADDDAEWRRLTRARLEDEGWRVLSARRGRDVAPLALRRKVDAIVLDHDMGDRDAAGVLADLRANPGTARTPVVVLSGHSEEYCRDIGRGARHFVDKGRGAADKVLACLQASMRDKAWDTHVLRKGDLFLEPCGREVHWANAPTARLSDEPFRLLYSLVMRSPDAVSSEELSRKTLTRTAPDGAQKALQVLATRLRKALPEALGDRIIGIRGQGLAYQPNAYKL